MGLGRLGRSLSRALGPERVIGVEPDEHRRRAAEGEGIEARDDLSAVRSARLVVEATPEDRDLKRRVLAELSRVARPETVIATGTSGIPLSALDSAVLHPERFLAAHFFQPVQATPIIECVAGRHTGERAVRVLEDAAMDMGKRVVRVRDVPGFFTTRILTPFVNEALLLVEEGVAVADLDAAFDAFGFALPPLRLLDLIGLDSAVQVKRQLEVLLPGRLEPRSSLLERLLEQRDSGGSVQPRFYLEDGDRGAQPNPLVAAVTRTAGAVRTRDREIEPDDILLRPLGMMLNEAVRALHRRIVRSAADGDLLAVAGLGFPVTRGGPFAYIERFGAARWVGVLERLVEHHGPRFAPPPLLHAWAEDAGGFPRRRPRALRHLLERPCDSCLLIVTRYSSREPGRSG